MNEVMSMKELYISPEANIIAFAPMERLANNTSLFGGRSLTGNGSAGDAVTPDEGDTPVYGGNSGSIFD